MCATIWQTVGFRWHIVKYTSVSVLRKYNRKPFEKRSFYIATISPELSSLYYLTISAQYDILLQLGMGYIDRSL